MSAHKIDNLTPLHTRIRVFTRKEVLRFEGISIANTSVGVYLIEPKALGETYPVAEWFPFVSNELQLVLV